MKLQSVKYSESDQWYSPEYVPDNPRSVLLLVDEAGIGEGYFDSVNNVWTLYRWNCKVNPTYWREMPRYHESDCSI